MPISFPTGYFNDPTVNPNPGIGQKGLNSYSNTVDPSPLNDNTQGFVSGSQWFNTTNNRLWECLIGTTGVAVWVMANQNNANFRNLLDGGDFTVNPWQRNINGIYTSASVLTLASAVTYFADRWAAMSASSAGSVNVSLIADSLLPGSKQHVQVARASANSNLSAISFVQVMEPTDVYRLQGQQVVLSFYAKAGANYSPAAAALVANVINGTGTVANTTVSSMQAATWTNQQTTFTGTATLSSAAWTRYQFTGTVPATLTSAASAVTQCGVQFQFTPVGTASANDWVQLDMIQLEVGATASNPERRDAQVELELCQRYAFVYAEPAASIAVAQMTVTTASVETAIIALPVQMVSAPTVTVAAGSMKVVIDAQTSAAAASLAAGVGHTATNINITTSNAATATAHAAILLGGGGAGYILASADY